MPSDDITILQMTPGQHATVVGFRSDEDQPILRRLMEMGVIEGTKIKLAHQGPITNDPVAIEIRGSLLGLRRSEAGEILVKDIES